LGGILFAKAEMARKSGLQVFSFSTDYRIKTEAEREREREREREKKVASAMN
jgi:hypothetical protein